MARHYVIQDWSNSATWSGEMIGDRLSKSKGHHFLKNGMANTEMYAGDEEEVTKKKTSTPLKQRILPQAARVEKLTAQMVELVQEYKQGLHTKEEYSLLLSVISAKRARAEQLLAKAVSVKAPFEQEEATKDETSAQHSPLSTSPIQSKKHVQIATNRVNKACQSAKSDLIYYTSAVVGVFTVFMWFTN